MCHALVQEGRSDKSGPPTNNKTQQITMPLFNVFYKSGLLHTANITKHASVIQNILKTYIDICIYKQTLFWFDNTYFLKVMQSFRNECNGFFIRLPQLFSLLWWLWQQPWNIILLYCILLHTEALCIVKCYNFNSNVSMSASFFDMLTSEV